MPDAHVVHTEARLPVAQIVSSEESGAHSVDLLACTADGDFRYWDNIIYGAVWTVLRPEPQADEHALQSWKLAWLRRRLAGCACCGPCACKSPAGRSHTRCKRVGPLSVVLLAVHIIVELENRQSFVVVMHKQCIQKWSVHRHEADKASFVQLQGFSCWE